MPSSGHGKNACRPIAYSFHFCFQVREQIESQVKNMIINYRDDEDLQNLVDWVQKDWVRGWTKYFVSHAFRKLTSFYINLISVGKHRLVLLMESRT